MQLVLLRIKTGCANIATLDSVVWNPCETYPRSSWHPLPPCDNYVLWVTGLTQDHGYHKGVGDVWNVRTLSFLVTVEDGCDLNRFVDHSSSGPSNAVSWPI